MKTLFLILASILLGTPSVGCSTNQTKDTIIEKKVQTNNDIKKVEYNNISPSDAKKRLNEEKGIVLLDVRSYEEYAEKHIPSSILIPVDTIDKEAQLKIKNKKSTIFVYCRSGRRSVTASESLVKQGYTNVFNLGGINDWPYETEAGESK